MSAATPDPGPLTLGTAGHIDHGKTALIRALTGADTDRLPQERQRGISIELGYASLTLPSSRRLSVIDVPGHERFVRAMVAGATGIDLYLMTIAADDGVMPQTREHAAVLAALEVDVGVVAVTKGDLADPELALLEASELLPRAERVAVCARTGKGIDELARALDRAAAVAVSRAARPGPARLHIDRVFTIRGAGTVATGTLWSGAIAPGDELELRPGRRHVRVRGVQVHDLAVPAALCGQRVAVNLTGVAVGEIGRGDLLAAVGSGIEPTYLIDAALRFGEGDRETGGRGGRRDPEPGDRVQVHHGTREAPARLTWLGEGFWQLRLEQALLALRGDRLVIRQIAPPDTLGGGVVLDAHPRKHGPSRERLEGLWALSRGEPVPFEDRPSAGARARPPDPRGPATPGRPTPAPAPLGPSALALEARLREAGIEPPLDSELDAGDLAALRAAGRAVRVSRTLHYHAGVLTQVSQRVVALAQRSDGTVTLAQVRDALGTSRKFAAALLEHLDSERVTIRRGEGHRLRSHASGGLPGHPPGPPET